MKKQSIIRKHYYNKIIKAFNKLIDNYNNHRSIDKELKKIKDLIRFEGYKQDKEKKGL